MSLSAWFGCCLVSAVLAVAWWPFGLIPACVLVVIASQLVLHRRRRRREGKA
jgi:CHASE2 domain-containing sensor protein